MELKINNRQPGKEFIISERTDSKRALKIGVIGAGLMGKWHADAAGKSGGVLVGFVDTDQNRAVQLTKHFKAAQSFESLEELLDKSSLDVLHICTPTFSHRIIAEVAIEAGVNLFIEKPLATTVAETIQLYEAGSKNNVRLCPAHQFAFQRCVRKAKELIPHIGRIIHLQSTICSAGASGLTDKDADTIVADILPHPLSLFQTFLNDLLPEVEWNVLSPQPGELRVSGCAREISLSIFVSMNARPTVNSLQIIGTNGTIHLDLFHDFIVLDKGKVSRERKILQPFDSAVKRFSAAGFNLMRRTVELETAYPGLRALVKFFYQSIREETEPPISPAQSINVANVRDFLMRGARIN